MCVTRAWEQSGAQAPAAARVRSVVSDDTHLFPGLFYTFWYPLSSGVSCAAENGEGEVRYSSKSEGRCEVTAPRGNEGRPGLLRHMRAAVCVYGKTRGSSSVTLLIS